MINGHGNDIHNYKGQIKADFSSNVWFEGPHPLLLDHLNKNIQIIANYPEPDSSDFAAKVEKHYQLEANNCIVTNGSVEGFYLLAKALKKKTAAIFYPSFAEYEDASERNGYQIDLISNLEINETMPFTTDMVWICNPNNPDGKIIPTTTIEQWLTNNPKSTFIVDEAYAELCPDFKSAIPLIKNHKNLIVVKSYTKAFAIPGLRLGIVLANKNIIYQLKSYQLPWSVNSLALTAGEFILQNFADLLFDSGILESSTLWLQAEINKLKNFEVIPSACNYFLVKCKNVSASKLKASLITKHGILIRDASNFHGLSNNHFRIAIQSQEKNEQLISALKQWI